MRCEQCREALSARLDGEDDPAERAAADVHLAGCAGCRQWYDAAATVTRLVRTSLVTDDVRVSDTILDAAPGPGRARLALTLRVGLAALGAAQFLLGAAQIAGLAGIQHAHTLGVGLAAADPGHLWHESAAWNVAVGAGFAWIALRRTRPAGIVPTLTAFVAVLSLLTIGDVIAGQVTVDRVFSHAFIVAGYVIILVLSHPALDPGEPPTGQQPPSRWRARFDDTTTTEPAPAPPLRLVRGLRPQAHAPRRRDAA
jgi:predicted anti-sigma-YlaC factor YlaD